MLRKRGFTLIELLVVISIIALLIGILLPALGAARKTANKMKNSTQVRGIIQGCILYAQGNGDYYPGITISSGSAALVSTHPTAGYIGAGSASADLGANVRTRLALLLNGNYFTKEYMVNPIENKSLVDASSGTTTVDTKAYSYAMLNLGTNATMSTLGRTTEWKSTTNSQAPVVGDRAKVLPVDTGDTVISTTSVWVSTTTSGDGSASNPSSDWQGSVGYNDNHVDWATSAAIANTKYGSTSNTKDNLFNNSTTDSGTIVDGSNALFTYK